jgi:1,4-dihydroxy-6-naphthoate synthase
MNSPLRIGQSADPDDAFMAWGLEAELSARGLEAELIFDDIETLNRAALRGELDLSAISVGAYPELADAYRMLRCGASFGDAYGPVVVACESTSELAAANVAGLRVATPGTHTTARLLLRIYAGDSFTEVDTPFDRIIDAVRSGSVDAGLIIHEGQLTYPELGLHALFEPAAEWSRREDLPVPLGAVAIRRDLDPELQQTVADAFAHGIHAGFENMDQALDFAASYARGLERDVLTEYVRRYVNAATLDMGERGERAINRLFELATEQGLLETAPVVDLL